MKTLNELLAIISIIVVIAAGTMTGMFGYDFMKRTSRKRKLAKLNPTISPAPAGVTA